MAKTQDPELMARAEIAWRRAYAPYSKFYVGAAVRTASGRIYVGCNFENGSYGATTCAERAAIAQAIACDGKRNQKIVIARIALVAKRLGGGVQPKTVSPCGICRQVLNEFAPTATVDFRLNGRVTSMRVSNLLPHAFKLK